MPDSDPNAPTPEPSPPGVPPSPRPSPRPKEKEEPSFEGLIGHLFASNKADGKRRNKEGGEMGLLDHLEELRVTIGKCVMAIGIGMFLVGTCLFKVLELVEKPLVWGLGAEKASTVLRMSGVMDIFTMLIQVDVFGGLMLALPFVAYFVLRFVVPGLTLREKSILKPTLASGLALFALGSVSCFRLALPTGIAVSYKLSEKVGITPLWDADKYYSLVIWSTLGMGMLFEFPLVLAILQMLGIVETRTLIKFWRQAVVVIMVLSSIVAPSADPVTMLAIAAPMTVLYAGSLVVGARMRKKYIARQAAKEAEEQASGV